MRLLIAEDDENVRVLFKRLIQGLTAHIVETGYLREARELCEKEEFDVIMLDLRLLDADSSETIAAIPDIRRKSGASIMVVTGAFQQDIIDRVMQAGADFCIQKGVDFSSFGRAVLMALHTAILKHPRNNAGDEYLQHVQMLETLVQAEGDSAK